MNHIHNSIIVSSLITLGVCVGIGVSLMFSKYSSKNMAIAQRQGMASTTLPLFEMPAPTTPQDGEVYKSYLPFTSYIPPHYTITAISQRYITGTSGKEGVFQDPTQELSQIVVVLTPVLEAGTQSMATSTPTYVLVLQEDSLGGGTYALIDENTTIFPHDGMGQSRYDAEQPDSHTITVSSTSWGEHAQFIQKRSYLFHTTASSSVFLEKVIDQEFSSSDSGYHLNQTVTLTSQDFGSVRFNDLNLGDDEQTPNSVKMLLSERMMI